VIVNDLGDDLKVTVSDNGPGIEPDFIPQIFDWLSCADSSRSPGSGGCGLGLAIALGLVRAHGGASFTITVPRDTGSLTKSES